MEWNKFTQDFFLNRESLANVLLLVDASIPPTDVDLSCAEWLAESEVRTGYNVTDPAVSYGRYGWMARCPLSYFTSLFLSSSLPLLR